MALFFSRKKKVNTAPEEKKEKTAPAAGQPEEKKEETAPTAGQPEEKKEETAPTADQPEEKKEETAPTADQQEKKKEETIPASAEPEEKKEEMAPASAEPEEKQEETIPASAEQEEKQENTTPSAGMQEDRKTEEKPLPPAYKAAPYVRSGATTAQTMFSVILALLPSAGFGVYSYGLRAAALLGICVATSVLTEFLCSLIWKRRGSVSDYSAVVTGLIGGLLLPPDVPYYYPMILAAVAIVGAKWIFGGIGRNILNPAGTGKLVLLILFYETMNRFTGGPYGDLTPLQLSGSGIEPDLVQMLYGTVPGCIGTTSAAAILAGAVILFVSGAADGIIPVGFITGFTALHVMLGEHGLSPYHTAIQLASGGLLFTAFFMAVDSTTSPVTRKGKAVYGLIMGCACFALRRAGFGDHAALIALLSTNVLSRVLDLMLIPAAAGKQFQKTIRVRSENTMKNGMTAEELERILLSQSEADFEMFEKSVLPRNAAAGSETAGTINRKSIEAYQKRKRVTTRRRRENRAMTQDELAQALRTTAMNRQSDTDGQDVSQASETQNTRSAGIAAGAAGQVQSFAPLEDKPAPETRFTNEYQQWLEQQMSELEQDTMRQLDVDDDQARDMQAAGRTQQEPGSDGNASAVASAQDENYEAFNGSNAYDSTAQNTGWQQDTQYGTGTQYVAGWQQDMQNAPGWQQAENYGSDWQQNAQYASGWQQDAGISGWQQGAEYTSGWQPGVEYGTGWQQEPYGNDPAQTGGMTGEAPASEDDITEDPKKGSYLAAARRMGYGNRKDEEK